MAARWSRTNRSPISASSGGDGLWRQFAGNCFGEIELRETLSGTSAVAASIVPARVDPNDRIRLGFIGLGGRARWLLTNEQFPGAEINDMRGDIFNDQGNSFFTTVTPPNATLADTRRSPYCTSRPELGLPCSTLGTSNRSYYFAARSKHTGGGVNAVLGDGSVRFYSDQIIPATWKELSTMQGGNPVPADGL